MLAPPEGPPFGVKLIAVYDALALLPLGLLAIVSVAFSVDAGVALFGLMFAAVLALAVGTWRLREWAWYVNVILAGLGVAVGFVDLLREGAGAILPLAVNVAILAYLAPNASLFKTRDGAARGTGGGAWPR